jgi:hypothetical protein
MFLVVTFEQENRPAMWSGKNIRQVSQKAHSAGKFHSDCASGGTGGEARRPKRIGERDARDDKCALFFEPDVP